ncbi:armadillo repeat-containing protein LFR [Physcomitrium patens]|uniref:armadillo repeat-containing protein LFR n=1 Tax=Physcomitrium patens TaxID=3218 RepID=UPI0001622893|nr:armadillo repeat-containing protein LFR-like [Physcomitrium patens]|eukprot:XP_024384580.1 armadillo repeat-containing protein LFR-like [Physcomitrella patens]
MAGPAGAGGGSGQKRGRPATVNAGNNANVSGHLENASGGTAHQPSPGLNLGPSLQVVYNFADQHTKRIVMALQSGLKGELAWAINALTLLSFKEKDDSRKDATPLAKVPGLLDSLLQVISEWRDIAHERVFAKLSRPRLLGADQPYTGFGLEYEIYSPDDAMLHIRAAAEKNVQGGDGCDAVETKEGWCWDEEGIFNLDEIGRHEKQICAVAVSNVLRNFSFMPENEASMAQHRGCLETLITVLEAHETEDEELVTNSIETLLNLATFLCFKIFTNNGNNKASNTGSSMSEKRMIDAIMMMLSCPVISWHCCAAELLGRLVVNPDNEPFLMPFVSQIFPRLVELLSTEASGDALAAAVAALHNFSEINTECRLGLASERWAVARLLRVVGSGNHYPQEVCRKAALTLENLASEPQNRAVMLSYESSIAELAVVDQRMSDVFARILWELSSGISSKMGSLRGVWGSS